MLPLVFAASLIMADAVSTTTPLPPSEPGAQAPAAPSPAAKPGKKKESPDDVICHNDERRGSRMPDRVCMTRLQWQQNEDATRHFFRNSFENGARNLPAPAGFGPGMTGGG